MEVSWANGCFALQEEGLAAEEMQRLGFNFALSAHAALPGCVRAALPALCHRFS